MQITIVNKRQKWSLPLLIMLLLLNGLFLVQLPFFHISGEKSPSGLTAPCGIFHFPSCNFSWVPVRRRVAAFSSAFYFAACQIIRLPSSFLLNCFLSPLTLPNCLIRHLLAEPKPSGQLICLPAIFAFPPLPSAIYL